MGLRNFTDPGARPGDSGKSRSPSASKQPCSACQTGQMVKSADRPSFFKYSPKNCDSALMEILSPGGGIGPRDQLLYNSVFAKKSNVSSVITRKLLNTRVDRVAYSQVDVWRSPRLRLSRDGRDRFRFRVDGRALGMNLHIKKTYRCRYLLTTTIIFAAVAVPAYAYMLRDNDARTEEIKAALPEAKAPTALVSKGINVDDVKDMVAAKAAAHGVPTDLARAVVQVESDYDIGLTGSVGEVGLMQIKFETARLLGYTGTLWELYEPETNIEWGMRYLAGARRLADGDLCRTAMRYNGGHGLKRMSRATTIYCNKIKRVLGLPTDSVPNGDPRDDRKDMVAARKDQSRRPEMFAAKQDKPAVVKLAAATVPAVATPAVPAPAAVAPAAVVAAERKIIAVAKPAKPVHHKADDEADGFEVRIVSHDVSETPIERKRVVPATTHRANVAGPFRLAEAFPDQPDSQAWFAEPKHETVAKPKPAATVAKAKPLPTVIKPKPIETAAAPQPAETVARTPVQRVAHAKPAVPVAHAQPAVPVTYVQPAMPVAHAQPAVQAAQPKAVASTVQPKPMVAMAQPKPVAPATQPKPVALAKTRSAVLAKPNPVETAATTTPAEPADTTGSIGVAPAQATVGEPN